MFALAPSKDHQTVLRYWSRNRYKAHVEHIRWTNRVWSDAPMPAPMPQVRLRHILMTDSQKTAVIKLTGSSPFIEKVFAPVRRGESRKQVGRAIKK